MSPKNQEQIDLINYYQAAGIGHPLTCGNQSKHALLQPIEKAGSLYLVCPTCGYTQTHIPTLPSIENMKNMKATMAEMFRLSTQPAPEPVEDTTQHRKIAYTVTFEVTENLEFDPADWDEDMQTMDQYQAYQMESKMDYSEEMFELLGDTDYKISNVKILAE